MEQDGSDEGYSGANNDNVAIYPDQRNDEPNDEPNPPPRRRPRPNAGPRPRPNRRPDPEEEEEEGDQPIYHNKTFLIGQSKRVNKVSSKPWNIRIPRRVGSKAPEQTEEEVQQGPPEKRVRIDESQNQYKEFSTSIDLTGDIIPLDAYHDDEVDIRTYNQNQDDRQWDPEDNHSRAADRHIRNYITNRSVERHVYNLNPDVQITEQERLILYKWTEAVMLEITVAQSIAGAATMLSMDQVMVPVYQAIPSGNEIITYDVLRKNAEKLLELQLNPLKDYIEVYNRDPAAYRRSVIQQIREYRGNRNDLYIPGVVNLTDIDPNLNNAENRVIIDFDYEIAKKSMFNVKYLRSLAEQYVKAQKRLRTLSPVAWNALDDAFNLVEDVFLQQGLNIDAYICRDPRKMQQQFLLSRKEFITFISRHPLLHTHICKAAGANLQATLNLRDGSYSSLRKYNTNDTRTLVYLFRTKHEVRKSVRELKELLEDVRRRPMLYLEYFIDTTKGIQQTGFQKWMITGNNQFPYQGNAPAANLPQPRNILPGWMNNINIMGDSSQALQHWYPTLHEQAPPPDLEPANPEPANAEPANSEPPKDTASSEPVPPPQEKIFVHNNSFTSIKDIIGRNRFFSE